MFSATFPEEIQILAGKFLYNYVFVAVGIVGSASTDVEQHFHMVSKFDKRRKLIDMLQECKCIRLCSILFFKFFVLIRKNLVIYFFIIN